MRLKTYLQKKKFFDLDQPDGWGGFVFKNVTIQLKRTFFNYLKTFCFKNNIISIFNKLNPLIIKNLNIFEKEKIFFEKKVIIVNLEDNLEKIFKNLKRSTYKEYKKSLKKKLQFCIIHSDLLGEKINCNNNIFFEQIYKLYSQTMLRNKAKTIFAKSYFCKLIKSMSPNILIVGVKYDNKLINFEIVFIDQNYSYSMYSGNDFTFKFLYSGVFLKIELIKALKNLKIKNYFIGGGYKNLDKIYEFKRNFSYHSEPYNFFSFREICNKEIFDKLCKNSLSQNKNIPLDYFQKYRY